jgi:hypothetical protein
MVLENEYIAVYQQVRRQLELRAGALGVTPNSRQAGASLISTNSELDPSL